MQYFVIWNDGQKFGPADVQTLNDWIAQGRITPTTELESVVDGSRLQASSLPGLNFPAGAGLEQEAAAAATPTATPSAGIGANDTYFVVAADGSKYGPADVATLTQWAADNRLSPTSQLENAMTGSRTTANMVPGIMFPTAAASDTVISPQQPVNTGYVSAAQQMTQSNYPRSGQPSASDLGGWNWGAFFLNWIWGLNHRYYLGLVCLIPCVGFFMAIYMGIKGNEIAWESGRFSSVTDMKATQKVWAMWGLGIFLVSCALQLVNVMLTAGSMGR